MERYGSEEKKSLYLTNAAGTIYLLQKPICIHVSHYALKNTSKCSLHVKGKAIMVLVKITGENPCDPESGKAI